MEIARFKIRRAIHADAEHIHLSHMRSIREICSKDYTLEQINAWTNRDFKAGLWWQAIDRDFIWVVEIDTIVRGFGHLANMGEGVGEVLGFYFAPEARGFGAGVKLMNVIKDEARMMNLKKIELNSTKTAKSFYEKVGFIQSADEDSVGMCGVQIECIPMAYYSIS